MLTVLEDYPGAVCVRRHSAQIWTPYNEEFDRLAALYGFKGGENTVYGWAWYSKQRVPARVVARLEKLLRYIERSNNGSKTWRRSERFPRVSCRKAPPSQKQLERRAVESQRNAFETFSGYARSDVAMLEALARYRAAFPMPPGLEWDAVCTQQRDPNEPPATAADIYAHVAKALADMPPRDPNAPRRPPQMMRYDPFAVPAPEWPDAFGGLFDPGRHRK